jgi:hypothetical protein
MQSVTKAPTRRKSKVTRDLLELIHHRVIKFAISVCTIIALFVTVSFANQDTRDVKDQPASNSHGHKWIIPVAAAAGFGLGLLIGFQAYDEAINSEQKIWTTAIAGAAIGAVGGWLLSRHTSRAAGEFVRKQQNIAAQLQIRRPTILHFHQNPASLSDTLKIVYSENMYALVDHEKKSLR